MTITREIHVRDKQQRMVERDRHSQKNEGKWRRVTARHGSYEVVRRGLGLMKHTTVRELPTIF